MSMLRVNSGTANEDCSHRGTLHSWTSPASCRHIAWQDAGGRGLRVGAVCTERELKPAQAGKSSGEQAATPNDSGPQANVVGRLLKIELDPAKSECCTATSAVQ